MLKKLRIKELNKRQLKLIGLIILLITLPLILLALYQRQNTTSRAAAPDKLETEVGVLTSTGVTKQTDSGASGGSFVLFNKQTSDPTPTAPSNARYIPDNIDSSGNNEVSGQIQSFINSSPDNSTIVFKQGATYQINQRLLLAGRNGITLEGNGAILKLTGPGNQLGGAIIIDDQSNGIKIQNFNVVGNYTLAGTTQACCSWEGHHAIQIYGSDNVLVDNVNVSRIGGDCYYIEPKPATNWPENITIRNSKCELTGRHGVMVEGGRNILVENSQFEKLGMYFVDFEPGNTLYGADGVTIRNNSIGSYGHTGQYDCWLISIEDAPWNTEGSVVRNIVVDNNTVNCGISGWSGDYLGINVRTLGKQGPQSVRENIKYTNNSANCTVNGGSWGVLRFYDVNGLTVTGNAQPYTGKLADFGGSTNITSDVPY